MNETQTPVALITGAAQRLGRSIALQLAHAGWDIAVHYGTSVDAAAATVAQIQGLGRRAVAIQADLGQEVEVSQLLARCAAQLGEPACLVNNASRFDFDAASSFSYGRLDDLMHINLAAPIALARDLYRRRVDQKAAPGSAVVVNLLDQKLFNLNPDFFSYTLSKAALQTATTLLAQALAPEVRIVGVAPGITLASADQTDQEFQRAHQKTALGRSSTPEDIAQAVCFAVAARAITGTTLLVDGGQHLVASPRDVMFSDC